MKKKYAIGVVMDPIESIKPYKDTSLAIMLAAKACGHRIFYMTIEGLEVHQGRARAIGAWMDVFDDKQNWYSLGDTQALDLEDLDCVLMRKDPPVDAEFIYAVQVLALAEKKGTLIVNRTSSLLQFNEKLFATHFPELCAKHLVSSQMASLKQFIEENDDTILKPLDGMGGANIFRVKRNDPNASVILEVLSAHGSRKTMAQEYLPAIKEGDKRILIIDGEAVPYALARLPAAGETRGNIAAGGRGRPQALSESDWAIAKAVGPFLKEMGLLFVGLDVIGDRVTEINVTSPTCAREIDAAYGTDIGKLLIDAIDRYLHSA